MPFNGIALSDTTKNKRSKVIFDCDVLLPEMLANPFREGLLSNRMGQLVLSGVHNWLDLKSDYLFTMKGMSIYHGRQRWYFLNGGVISMLLAWW